MSFASPAFQECPHCGTHTPHRLVMDGQGQVAWCQVCYHVSAVPVERPEGEAQRQPALCQSTA